MHVIQAFDDLFQRTPGAMGDKKCCMTRKKPRWDDLNSLTGVSFGRWCFYMGDKHLRDETVVAGYFCVCVCACAQGFVNLCWHKDPCMMYQFKGTLMPKFDKGTFLQLFALIPQPGSEWPRLVVNINVKPVRRSKDEPVGWWLMQPGANIIHCLTDTSSSAPIGENLRDTVYLRINFTVQHGNILKQYGQERPSVTAILPWLRGENSNPTSRGLLLLRDDSNSNTT